MINISVAAIPNGATLTIRGHGGFASFELSIEQACVLRDALDTAVLRACAPCPTIAALIEQMGIVQ